MVMFAPVVVNLLGFKANSVDHNSKITFGPVAEVDIFIAYKRNQGFGEQNGDLSSPILPVTAVNDPDVIDSNSIKESLV